MNITIITTVITLIGSILLAGISYWFTKSKERNAELRKEKLEHYKKFVESMNEIIEGDQTPEGHLKFAKATNNLMLIAPQTVIEALYAFRHEISFSNTKKDQEKHDFLLSNLMFEIRKDLKIHPKDNKHNFKVILWSSGNSRKCSD